MIQKNSAFGFDEPEDSPGFMLWQTTITWQRHIKKVLAPHTLSHAQFVILAILLWLEEHQTDPHQTLLASLSKLDKMTVSKSLKILTASHFVERHEHTKDPRAKSVRLTNKGREKAQQLVPIVEAIDANFFKDLTPEEERKLVTLLRKVIPEK